MKAAIRIAFFLLILICSCQFVLAQSVKVGVELGQNASQIRMADLNFQSTLDGSFHIGITSSIRIFRNLGIESGVTYMKQSHVNGSKNDFFLYRINHIDNLILPMDLTYETSFGLKAGIGFYTSYNLNFQPQSTRFYECLTGVYEIPISIYNSPLSYGSRVSVSMILVKNSRIDAGYVLRYYYENPSISAWETEIKSQTLSFSLIANFKGS